MTALRFNIILLLCLTASILLWGRPGFSETTISEQILSTDLVIKDAYEPGNGLPVGKIQSVQGEAIVFHRDPAVGYRLQTGAPLYVGDIMHTRGTARILCRLIDGSSIVLTPETTLTIIQSRYNSIRKTGVSFLYLKHGGARFTLNPRTDLSSYDFKVQTELAFALARDADFVVKANPEATDIIAFENSQVEITGMSRPEDVTILSGPQKTFVSEENSAPAVETLTPEDIEILMADFHSAPRSTLLADGAGGANENPEDNKSEEMPEQTPEEPLKETPAETLIEEDIAED
jgi:hypothetical protein